MKVFISWSGKRSKALAGILRDWLPLVLQYVEPWVSDKDISAGDRWAQAIAGELEASNFGIICITPENLNSEWILFESGALSKSMLDGKVIPLLYGLELSDLSGPLSQFQAQKVEESGIVEVVRAINKVSDTKASDQTVEQLIPALWPRLKESLDKIPESEGSEKHMRPQHEILEELVSGVRGLNSRMRDFDPEVTDRDRDYRQKNLRFHPRHWEEFVYAAGEVEDASLSLLMIAGLVREDFPWLAEILNEAYREIRSCDPEGAEKVLLKLVHTVKVLFHGSPLVRDMANRSKSAMMLSEEFPMFLDMTAHRILQDKQPRNSGRAKRSES